jgi:hypothetical protein
VYGVSLQSDIPFALPELSSEARTGAQVRLARARDEEFGDTSRVDGEGAPWFLCRERDDGSIYLRWSTLYEFLVTPCGTRVSYRPLEQGEPGVLQNFLFGQALSYALVRQGVEPLHATAIDVGGCAIALLGDCTFGKSTLAASFLQAGYRLVTDDVLNVHECDGHLMAHAGTGRIKLEPAAAVALLGGTNGGIRLIPTAEKLAFQLHESMVQRADVPLTSFFILPTPDERQAADRIELRPVSCADLFRELVKSTFVCDLDSAPRLRWNFAVNSRIASLTPGFSLRYPPGLDRVPAVRDAILGHLRRQLQGDIQ